MNILVTGGAGFIGANFIKYWLENHPEDKIINLDKLTYAGNLENTSDFQSNKNYRFIYGDICDEKLVDRLMKQVDIVVHFAAETHVDRSIENPDVFLQTNILGTGMLLRLASKYNIKRFHYISTDEVFGSLSLSSKAKFSEKPYTIREALTPLLKQDRIT
jgi:dTDP-glucose 4,6-dehydratase